MIINNNDERYEVVYINGIRTDYIVYESGKIWSMKDKKFITDHDDSYGYRQVSLNVEGKNYTRKVHRLVAIAFIPNINNLPEVNHINGKKHDNNVKNLEWVTPVENTHHAMRNNLRYAILNEDKVEKICELLSTGQIHAKEISKKYGIPVSNVIKIKNGLTWKSISNKYDFSKYKFNRINYGSKNGNSSIDEKTARKICLLLKDGKTPTEISKDINISRKIVYDIKHRLTWCNIYEEVIC